MKKPDSGSKACSLGVLADLFDALGGNSAEGFIKQLLPTFQQFTKVINFFELFNYSELQAEDDNVRNNATFGIGVLIACGGATGATLIDR